MFMPIITFATSDPAIDGRQSQIALEIRNGVIRGMRDRGLVFIPEFTLPKGRRADLIGLDAKGNITIVEIKSSVADYNADSKWFEYAEFCDQFYFASHPSVPSEIFPEQEGFILADKHGCEVIRDAERSSLSAATRKSLMIKIARASAEKLQRITDFHGDAGLTK